MTNLGLTRQVEAPSRARTQRHQGVSRRENPILLLTGCVVLCSTVWTGSLAGTVSADNARPALQPGLAAPGLRMRGRAMPRGAARSARVSDRTPDGLVGNGRACADCHMPTDSFQLSPASAEARFQFLQWRRRWNPDADDPLFRPIDADDFRTSGDSAIDFSNLRQNGLVRITLSLPPTIRLIDPVTNAVSNETTVDVWRMVPTVNDVALTGPDASAPVWPRDPNPTGGYQLDARITTLQEQALGALVNHAQIPHAPQTAARRPVFIPAHAVHESSSPRAGRCRQRGRNGSSASGLRLNEVEQHGKAVFERACSQCHGGPGQSTPVFPVNRFSTISSQCPRPVDTVTPARFTFAECPPRLARNARTYEIVPSLPTQGPTGIIRPEPGCGARAPTPAGRCRPGSWAAPAPLTIGTSSTCPDCAGSARPLRTSTTTAPPRSRTWSITMCSSSSE